MISVNKPIKAFFGSAPRMRVSYYLQDGFDACSNLVLAFSSAGSTFSSYMTANISRVVGFHQGWNTVDIYPGDWLNTGGEDWAEPMNRIRLSIIAMPERICDASIDSISTDLEGSPAVILSFDDGWDNLYTTVYPLMKSMGQVATAYIITDKLNTSGFVTDAQIQEMYADGWTIGNHSRSHLHLSTLDLAWQQAEIGDAMKYLAELGITSGRHFAMPYGDWNEDTLTACRSLGIWTGRTVQYRSYPIAADDQRLLLSSHPVANTDTLEKVKGFVDEAASKNTPVWLQFHGITESAADSYAWAAKDFSDWLEYILA
jgi:peptidoglycan/xylan/chitin deacetylase (PgdA/CDA1 family)